MKKMDISEHLEQNNENIKVKWHINEGIIIENIIFNIKGLIFSEKKESNYTFINKYKERIDISTIKQITFNNCTFPYEPSITSDNIWYLRFNNCIFENTIDISKNILADINKNKKVYFKNCNFEKFNFGDIKHIQYNSETKLSYFEINGGSIESFMIENIEFASKFYINKEPNEYKPLKINRLIIKNSIFKENFKMHNCEIDEISIDDSDFKKQFDFYKSTFESGIKDKKSTKAVEINFNALNITGLTIFDNTEFYEKMKFAYVSFDSSINFRNATLKNGFDLDKINLSNDSNINFYNLKGLDTTKSINNTSQETYRIIKYHLDSIGNKIDSNKYHSLELLKKHNNIWNSNEISPILLFDGIISAINCTSSYFSKYWILPLFWIFIVSVITSFCISYNNMFDYEYQVQYLSILALEGIKLKDTPWVFLFHKVSLGYLYYQFLTAVKKDTKK